MLTNVTNPERKEFKKLQEQGMLPSQALRKIETDKRLGIIDDEGYFKSENLWFYASLAVIGSAILYVFVKGKISAQELSQKQSTLTIDNIDGIDTDLLNMIKEKGLY